MTCWIQYIMETVKVKQSPLRYPGGKSRAVKFLFDDAQLPDNITEYREPFLGGGSCAIAFTKKYPDIPVWVNDKYYELYCFWKTLQNHSEWLRDQLLECKTSCKTTEDARDLFNTAKDTLNYPLDSSSAMVGMAFFIMNKCSFSGLSSGFSAQASVSNFSVAGIERLPLYSELIKNWQITNLDYNEMLDSVSEDTFLFLDPPYDINSFLYGKKGNMHSDFDHYEFQGSIKDLKCKTMITYNSNDKLKEMYKGWNQTEWDLTYTLHSGKNYRADQGNRKELLLTNYTKTKTPLEEMMT